MVVSGYHYDWQPRPALTQKADQALACNLSSQADVHHSNLQVWQQHLLGLYACASDDDPEAGCSE